VSIDLTGRTVLVTGGNGGIGLGIATAAGRSGARVIIWGRNSAKNASALDALAAEDIAAHALECDVTDEQAVNDAFARSVEFAGGRVDSVVANAGSSGFGTDFLELSVDEWHRVLDVNLTGVFLVARAAARHMVAVGDGGALVMVSSTAAIHGAANNEAYGSAKSAVLGLTRALAVRLARHRIRVNAILPGWTATDQTARRRTDEKFMEITTRRTPVRRWAEPDEIARAGVYLCDPTNTFHTGDTLVVDGGYTIA